MLRYEPLSYGAGEHADAGRIGSLIRPQKITVKTTGEWLVFANIAVLLLSDLCALTAACSFGYLVWVRAILHQPVSHYLRLFPLLVLFPMGYAAAGLYPGFGLGAVETLRRLFRCNCICFLALTAVCFSLKVNVTYSRMAFALIWLATLVAVPLFRYIALSLVSGLRWWGYPTVVVGSRSAAGLTVRTLKGAFSLGYRVVGVILPSPEQIRVGEEVEGIPVLGGVELAPGLGACGVRTALVWDSSDASQLVADIQHCFAQVVLIRDERSIPIENLQVRNLGGVLGIEIKSRLFTQLNQIIKRGIDLVLGTTLLLAASPIIFAFGLSVKLVSEGPMFFSQEREGLHGSKFKLWKLRTMYVDAEDRLAELLRQDPRIRRQWMESMKLDPDPRIIFGLGRFLRRYSIDELPQLFGVVTGSMSLVGPRPFPEYHMQRFSPNFRALRTVVRPGLTGMWQVMVRSSADLTAQELYDTYYIRNWSLGLDIYILAKSVFAVLTGRGAC